MKNPDKQVVWGKIEKRLKGISDKQFLARRATWLANHTITKDQQDK